MVRLMSLISERGSVVGVYDMSVLSNPILKQPLPSGLSPVGAIALQRVIFLQLPTKLI